MAINLRPEIISYYEHEAEIARSELHARRWMIAAFIAFVILIGSNAVWIYHEINDQKFIACNDGDINN